MKVARAYSIDDVRIEEVPVPSIGSDEALLKVEACGLCTSDCLDWYVARKAPLVLGHEPTGSLVEVGRTVERLTPGLRVFTHHHVPCGECPRCRRGADTACRLFRETSLDPGGFAEYVRIPAANLRRDTLVLPEGMDWETGTWIEPLACSLRVFTRCPPLAKGATVLVVGLGSMGLLNGMTARLKGAARLIGSDPVEVRRSRALELGFDAVINPSSEDPGEAALALADGEGADLVIVGPGSAAAIESSFPCLAPGGTIVLFSPSPPDLGVTLRPHPLYFGEGTITASYSCGPRQTREALGLLAAGRIDPRPLVTMRVGLASVGEAIRRTIAKGADLKAIVFPGSQPGEGTAGPGAG